MCYRYAVDLVVCVALGCDMFDCVFPTRTAVSSHTHTLISTDHSAFFSIEKLFSDSHVFVSLEVWLSLGSLGISPD